MTAAGGPDPRRGVPVAVLCAAVLTLPCVIVVVVLGGAALALAGQRSGSGAWGVLLVTVGWLAALLTGVVRLLLGRSWLNLAVAAGVLAGLLTVGIALGGLRTGPFGLTSYGWLVAVATTVLASLPGVRRWVGAQRRDRLHPGSSRRGASGA